MATSAERHEARYQRRKAKREAHRKKVYKFFDEDGNTVAYADSVRYIKLSDNGCYVETDADSAEGVAVNGTAYSLMGKTLEGAESAVGITEIDGAALVAQQEAIIDELLIASLEG